MKEELKEELLKQLGELRIEGEIVFFLDGKEVGRNELPNSTFMKTRHMLAEDCGVKEYNDFHLVRKNGDVVKASEKRFDNFMGTVDIDTDIGTYEGQQYKLYKYKHTCDTCGGIIYKLPEFKG